jgi:hypothetical protein
MLYGSTLNSFKSTKDNSYIVFWKIEMEFAPLFYVYYIKDGKLMKIGEWEIIAPCDTCDTGDYSVEDIQIFQKDEKIEFLFLKEIRFVNFSTYYDSELWGTFETGELTIAFNLVDGTLKRVIGSE